MYMYIYTYIYIYIYTSHDHCMLVWSPSAYSTHIHDKFINGRYIDIYRHIYGHLRQVRGEQSNEHRGARPPDVGVIARRVQHAQQRDERERRLGQAEDFGEHAVARVGAGGAGRQRGRRRARRPRRAGCARKG